jgi:hypothetical protein
MHWAHFYFKVPIFLIGAVSLPDSIQGDGRKGTPTTPKKKTKNNRVGGNQLTLAFSLHFLTGNFIEEMEKIIFLFL